MFSIYLSDGTVTKRSSVALPEADIEYDAIWSHFEGEMVNAEAILNKVDSLDEQSLDALCDELTRPRVFENDQNQLVVTLRATTDSELDLYELRSVRLLVSGNSIISLSKTGLEGINKLACNPKKIELIGSNPDQLLWEVCNSLSECITDKVLCIDDSLIDIEKAWEESESIDVSDLQEVRRGVSSLQRYLHPQLEAFKKLSQIHANRAKSKGEKRFLKNRWRETGNALSRDIESLSDMRERVSILRDGLQHKSSESMSRTMLLMSVLATFFLPLTFLASLLGMNVSGIPGHDHPNAFLGVCTVMVMISLVQVLILKSLSWLKK